VAEIVAKITTKYKSLVKIILESQIEPSYVIYKYSITITEDIYEDKENQLIDFCKIKYIDKTHPFDGLLKDFYEKLIQENKEYRIKELEEDIKKKQKELDNLNLKIK